MNIFRKCVRPSFLVKKLRWVSKYIHKFAEACVLSLILHCSPAIYPGLLKHGFTLLKRSIKQISQVSGLRFSNLTKLVCERLTKASSDFAEKILGYHHHHHQEPFQAAALEDCSISKLCPPGVITTLP